MKIYIDNFEVEIKARNIYEHERATEMDTLTFLSEMATWLNESASLWERDGHKDVAKMRLRQRKGIMDCLIDRHFYQRYREKLVAR